jgi:hypothetical protein
MAKPTSLRNPSLRLASDIEQCEAALADKTNSLQRGCASVQKDLRSLRRDFNKAKDSRDLTKLNKLVEKRDLLRLRVRALEKEVEQFRAHRQKQLNLLQTALRERYERMRGLLSYGIACGRTNPDCKLVFDSLGDYLEAKSDSDRQAAQRAVNLIFDHGDLGDRNDETGTDDAILRQFAALTDPGERSRFYQRHRAELIKAHDVRQFPNP